MVDQSSCKWSNLGSNPSWGNLFKQTFRCFEYLSMCPLLTTTLITHHFSCLEPLMSSGWSGKQLPVEPGPVWQGGQSAKKKAVGKLLAACTHLIWLQCRRIRATSCAPSIDRCFKRVCNPFYLGSVLRFCFQSRQVAEGFLYARNLVAQW